MVARTLLSDWSGFRRPAHISLAPLTLSASHSRISIRRNLIRYVWKVRRMRIAWSKLA
jgi:hypothetical protein